MLIRSRLLYFVLLLQLTTFCSIYADSTYPIDWNSVPDKPKTRNTRSDNFGACICDLTSDLCDTFCCCDPDCSNTAVRQFEKYGDCLPEKNTIRWEGLGNNDRNDDDKYCLDEGVLIETHRVESTKINNQLCVLVNNNPNLGRYYKDTKTKTNAGAFSVFTKPGKTFQSQDEPTQESLEFYRSDSQLNYNLVIQYEAETTIQTFLSLPKASLGSECMDTYFAKFLVNEENTCDRRITDLADACDTFLNIGFGSSFVISEGSDGLKTITPTIDAIYFQGESEPAPGEFTTQFSGGACLNAVVGVHYRAVYDQNKLTDFGITFIIVDSISEASVVEQEYKIVFKTDNSISSSLERSGNPGYDTNKPVLIGTLVESDGKEAIQMSSIDAKMYYAAPTSEGCESDSMSVLFGEDVVASCLVSYTYADLSDSACQDLRSNVWNILQGNRNFTHVAAYGDANYLNVAEWVEVIIESPPGLQNPASSTPICRGVPHEQYIQFLTAWSGSYSNPQKKIVGARITYDEIDIAYECYGFSCAEGQALTHELEIRTVVAFINVNEDLEDKKKKLPPFLPSLPRDILYPFFVGSSSTNVVSIGTIALAVILYIVMF